MKSVATVLCAIAFVGVAQAQVMAMLVRQYMGRSVTGQQVVVCVYQVNGKQFERAMPLGSICEPSIMVQ